ncbi:MAG: diadenylate cyclase CdaA [Spirochaetes bacterium]|nr:diadenylate cyclase CdaA [Spirochaetota bacterium]
MILFHLPLLTIILNFFLAVVDIFIISFIFYKFYQILSQTKAVQVIKGLAFFVALYFLSRLLRLEAFSWMLDKIASVMVLAIIILFQPELRRVLTKLGQNDWVYHLMKKNPKDITNIINAIQNFHILHIGSIIVFERNVGLKNIIESGTVLNAKISTSLLLTIFTNKSPLHDGAIIIKNDMIIAAGCFLPLSDSSIIKKEFGTRHRAALGISEESDAVAIVVSEETGTISLSYDGKLFTDYDINELEIKLLDLLGYDTDFDEENLVNEKI